MFQYTPTVRHGDAVGNDARALDRLMKEMGLRAGLYCEELRGHFPGENVRRLSRMPKPEPEDVFIYHHSIACSRTDWIRSLNCRKVMVYHNITPPEYFLPYDVNQVDLCRRGLRELREMNDVFSWCLADSEFNRQDLLRAGYACPVDVLPVLIPFEDYRREPDAATLAKYGDGRTNILFVGRIAPNKKQENLIRAFDCYKKTVDPEARLILVGSSSGARYRARLEEYIRLNGVEDVVFPGHIRFEEILAFYRTASVFLCLSEHEGFCVPLLEAMSFDVPVIALDAAAVPYTLGGSGLLLPEPSPKLAAAAVERLVRDTALRAAVVEGQRARLRDFSYETVSARFRELFRAFLDRNAGTEGTPHGR